MDRFASTILNAWLGSHNRKPLVIRGARQTGKTWLVRAFAEHNNLRLIELNLEKFPGKADLFSPDDPLETLKNIEADLGIKIDPGSSCLFLDEIQAAPELFAKLRWFKEDKPELPIIAAGSLLEFALSKSRYSMPVGRITYLYLEPMSFFEFILASGNEQLYQRIIEFEVKSTIPQSIHEKCMGLYHQYCLTGGMPEAVKTWIDTNDLQACIKVLHDLLSTYRDDFYKFGGDIDARLLNKIMLSVAQQLGTKFIYSRVDPGIQAHAIKKSLTLLFQARVCSLIAHTSGNGLPLGAQSNEKFFKALMLDVGLISAQLGLSSVKPTKTKELIFTNKGGIAEQFVGQQLRSVQAVSTDPQLFYWQRTGGRLGEIDYIIQHADKIIPVEVKSGTAGGMKSLHQFMAEKKLELAVRIDSNTPRVEDVDLKTTSGQPVKYRLLSIPLYFTGRVSELIDEIL
ncbi:MAG: ATP-binding protein [Deltaproteobacteria bacterium]|nr:ATP-binding protein [Deltaproteobacteria bacterium]